MELGGAASRSRTSSSSSFTIGGRTSRSASAAAISAAFDDGDDGDDDEFGAFAAATATTSAAPSTNSSFYNDVFSSSSSSASSFSMAAHTTTTAAVSANARSASHSFSHSGFSELSFEDEYDNPFADIVNGPPPSANGSRTNSFSGSGVFESSRTDSFSSSSVFDPPQQHSLPPPARSVDIDIGSPLLSFSPVAAVPPLTVPSTLSIPDIFSSSSATNTATTDAFSMSTSSAPTTSAEAELLSFSPLTLSASAPVGSAAGDSSLPNGFLLDPPASSPPKVPPPFALPPPRAATMPSMAPVVSGTSVKSASLSGEVSVGELLSFSPVASAPVASFSDSFSSSSATAASGSMFGDDDLFSLSTTGMTMDLSAVTVATMTTTTSTTSPVTPLATSFYGSTVDLSTTASEAFGSGVEIALDAELADESVVADATSEEDEGGTIVSESQSAFEVEKPRQEHDVFASADDAAYEDNSSPASDDAEEGFEYHQEQPSDEVDLSSTGGVHVVVAASEELYQRSSMIESSVSATDAVDVREEEEDTTLPSKDTERVPIPSPVGYSQFDFITQDFTPQATQSEENYDSLQASPVDGSEHQRYNDVSTQNSPSDYAQYNTFSQESIGNAYAPMGDSSDEDLEGYAPSMSPPAHTRGSFSKVAGTTTASESASSTTVDPCDGERDPFTPSSHGSGEEFNSRTDKNAFGESGDSAKTASSLAPADDDDEFGDFGTNGDVETETFSGFEKSVIATSEAFVSNSSELAIEAPASSLEDDDEDFGDFGTAPSSASQSTSVQFLATASFSANASGGGDADAFGDFSHDTFTSEDDDFGDFGQSSHAMEDDDDFGDFGQSSSADDGFTDFQQSSSFGQSAGFNTAVSDDDDFGDFSAPQQSSSAATSFVSVTMPPAPSSIYVPSTSKPDLQNFFKQAFPAEASTSTMDFSLSTANFHSQKTNEIFQEKGRSDVLVERIFREAVETYFADAAADATDPVPSGAEHYLSELKATRLKHLKYVLTEKIQEAARHDGIFPHGSQQHHVLLSLVNSDDEQKMRNALTSVQNSLFTSSVNDAMMRMARQAALSAKAKIAEQAAQQQASSRGSLLATTRQLLSRTAGSTDHQAESAAGASSSSGNGYNSSSSGDETSNDGGDGSHRHSSGSHDSDFNPSSSRNSSSGGLMKKFQDRFSSFSASRSRARTVSLRRKGQSGEDVRKMELNMDSISGGFDEVKWKCAVFLYDVEEVAHVAPSQIKIIAYPSKEVLAGKSDRTVLMKFLKPGAIWTIDIGASNNDVLNEW